MKYAYRLIPFGYKGVTYEVGELDEPRSFPDMWCDRRLCEGFWGDEEKVKSLVAILNELSRLSRLINL